MSSKVNGKPNPFPVPTASLARGWFTYPYVKPPQPKEPKVIKS